MLHNYGITVLYLAALVPRLQDKAVEELAGASTLAFPKEISNLSYNSGAFCAHNRLLILRHSRNNSF
jgi:hypothetical protein